LFMVCDAAPAGCDERCSIMALVGSALGE
jgi:hypothetical protein